MFETARAKYEAPKTVQSDLGPSMKSNVLREVLAVDDVELSHNRPYVSNDNPFSESAFRTIKYHPGYQRVFKSVESARAYIDAYVPWYNTAHKHSVIALFSPAQVYDGSWVEVWDVRDAALQSYYRKNHGWFRRGPVTTSPADHVGINLPEKEAVGLLTWWFHTD